MRVRLRIDRLAELRALWWALRQQRRVVAEAPAELERRELAEVPR